jgi:hypothetical protein
VALRINRPSRICTVRSVHRHIDNATWSFDPDRAEWELLGGAPAGLDTLVTTRHGVMGIDVDWPSRLNDAGHLLPYDAGAARRETSVYLFDGTKAEWKRVSRGGDSPQNLYEITSLAYDSTRDRLILHGGGARRDELWIFDIASGRWRRLEPAVARPRGAAPPACTRESVYLPRADLLLIYGPAPEDRAIPALWGYTVRTNAWRRIDLEPMSVEPERRVSRNRALVYDPVRDLVFLVLGAGGDSAMARVYRLRLRAAGE